MSDIGKTTLGSQGLIVPPIGLGCMTMTTFAGNDVYGEEVDDNGQFTFKINASPAYVKKPRSVH